MTDWRQIKLGDIAEEVTVGHVGSMAQEYISTGIPLLRSQNVLRHGFDLSDVKYIDEAFHLKLKKSALRGGDVVTVRTGKPGSTAVVPAEWSAANCSDLVITRPGPQIDPYWLSYYINSAAAGYIDSQLVGAVQQHFNVSSAKNMNLNLPSLQEQRAIAEVLGALDDKIAANTKLAATAVSLLEAHFAALGLNQDPGEDTPLVGLDELVELNPKVAAPVEAEPVYVDMQKIPVANISISDWDHRPAKGGARFKNGDTLLARITPCLENRKTGFVDFLDDGQVGIGSTEFIVLRSRAGIPIALSYFIATSERFRTFAIRHMVGTSGRQRVSALDLTGYTVSKPDDRDLAEFEESTGCTFVLMKSLTDENRSLAATRDALLPQLMSGKLRVREAEELVSAVV
ncbi:restriction endonuclease subunit S [Paenarthrobacter sp. Z7-10]|uniref:restriction endonuclease subunit S n=1 Tax=Paenarthrobacter sp. Z7-10 TaxID=2787635 RepID=UPI0022A912F2|nr:restriction endonuclease subunit S [Paenarthrobacter sp. Z7-10]MCZ2402036.1 restriction endonuclease subunit S [Paenarthrobacter sp. Z7-10]